MASFQGIHQERESKRETERDGDICWPSNVLFRISSEVQRGLENCPAITISASILKPLVCRQNYRVHKALGTKKKDESDPNEFLETGTILHVSKTALLQFATK